jgi:acetyl esterase/lipase
MRRLPVVLLFIALPLLASAEDFWSEVRKADQLEDQNKLQEAVAAYEEIAKRFPERRAQVHSWIALDCVLLGQYEKAMELWRDGHAQGLFYGIAPARDPYNKMTGLAGFEAIAKRDVELRDAAAGAGQMRYEMAMPAGYSASRKYPLFIVLHGGGDSIDRAKTYWTSPALRAGYLVAYMQSYLPFNSWAFGWRGNDPRGREGVRKLYEEIVAKYPVDTARVFIGGMSAGGMMSLDAVFQKVIPAAGFVVNCPVIPRDFAPEMAGQMHERGVRGAIITGDKDFAYEAQQRMVEAFTKAGLPHQFVVIPGMGHSVPKDFPTRFDAALKEVDKGR